MKTKVWSYEAGWTGTCPKCHIDFVAASGVKSEDLAKEYVECWNCDTELSLFSETPLSKLAKRYA